MGKRLTGLALALVVAAGTIGTAQQSSSVLRVAVTRDGGPAPNVQVDMQLLNQGKVAVGVTGAAGDLALALSVVNAGKPTRMQVVIYDCPNDQQIVVFVQAGAEAPGNLNCKRRVAGWVWFGRARAVTIDVARGTIATQGGESFLGSTRGRLIAGGGAAAVGLFALSAGGGDSSGGNTNSGNNSNSGSSGSGNPPQTAFDPNGNYPVTNVVASDPGNHRTFIAMEGTTVLVINVTGTTIRITCPPGSKWTLLNGTINTGTGQLTAEGRGPAAGVSNVLFRISGTLHLTGADQGIVGGQLTVGAGGEFPGGQPTVFNVAGRKQ